MVSAAPQPRVPSLQPRVPRYQQLAALLAAELQPLSVQLAEQHARLQAHDDRHTATSTLTTALTIVLTLALLAVQALDDPHRYIYFNRLNLALKCSLRGDRGGARPGAAAGALRLSSSR